MPPAVPLAVALAFLAGLWLASAVALPRSAARYGVLTTALLLGGRAECAPSPHPDPPAVPEPAPKTAPEEKPKLVLTDDTVVTLDGAVCKFADVPGDADIVSLSVAADKKTILKIEFKSKK